MFKGRKPFAVLAVTLATGGTLAAAPVASADEASATYAALNYANRIEATGNRSTILRVYSTASYWGNWCVDVGEYNDPCQFWVALSAFLEPYAMLSL